MYLEFRLSCMRCAVREKMRDPTFVVTECVVYGKCM